MKIPMLVLFTWRKLEMNPNICKIMIWASMQENPSSWFPNNKGTDQPAHPRSLISAFVIRLLECIISTPATSKISIF